MKSLLLYIWKQFIPLFIFLGTFKNYLFYIFKYRFSFEVFVCLFVLLLLLFAFIIRW